jgi:ribonuclease E
MKRDRARAKILRTSPFGLIEMTRQRIRPSLKRSVYRECPACAGTGLVKSAESMAIDVLRRLMRTVHHERVAKVTVTVEEAVANYLNNRKRRELAKLEDDGGAMVLVLGKEGVSPEFLHLACEDEAGREVRLDP